MSDKPKLEFGKPIPPELIAEQSGVTEDYCLLCGEGPFPIADLVTITPEIDPYLQISDDEECEPGCDNVSRACKPCFKEKYEE